MAALVAADPKISQLTPVHNSSVPAGHILASLKWKGMEIITHLKELGPLQFSDSLGLIDFQVSSQSAIVYLMESDVICVDSYKNNLIKIRKANNSMAIVVVVEKTPITEPYFRNVQQYVILTLGLKLIPVATKKDAAQFLHEMSIADSKSNCNPFRNQKRPPTSTFLVKFLQEINGIDETKAEKLLQHFSSIRNICNSSREELSSIIGDSSASHVKVFLSKSQTKT